MPSPVIQTRLSDLLHTELDKTAARLKMNRSVIVREAVARYLKTLAKRPTPRHRRKR